MIQIHKIIPHEIDSINGTNHQHIRVISNGDADGLLILQQSSDVVCFSKNQLRQLRDTLNSLGELND